PKNQSLERYAQLQKCIGDIERLRSNYDKAIGIYNSILFIFNILNIKLSNIKRLDTEIANVYKDKGYIYQTLGNANRSIYNYRLAEKNYRSVGEWYGVALAKRAIGYIIVAHNPDDIKGVGMLIESLRFFIKNKYYGAMTTCLESLSNVCIAKGDFDSAMEHLNMSINIVGIKNIGGGNSLRKRGLLYMTLGDYDKSEVDLLESARVFRSLKSLRNEALVFSDIGELYGITNRYGDAVEAYERSVQLYGAVGLEQGRLDCQNRLAEIRARMQS
ncbi:MAG: tetratricopeptide repeat protein, partial [Bacteroidota bacterium]